MHYLVAKFTQSKLIHTHNKCIAHHAAVLTVIQKKPWSLLLRLEVGPLVTKELSNSVVVWVGGTKHPRHHFLCHTPHHFRGQRLAVLVAMETIDWLQELPGLSALRRPDVDCCMETVVFNSRQKPDDDTGNCVQYLC